MHLEKEPEKTLVHIYRRFWVPKIIRILSDVHHK